MKTKMFFVLLVATCLLFNLSYAQNEPFRVGTTAANFLEMGIGCAGNAMGEAYVSATRDLSSIYWNPSGLAYMESNEVLFMYQPWIADINIGFAAAGIVLPRIGTLALSLTSMNYGRTEVTTLAMQDGTGETYEALEYAVSFSYARKLVQWFAFGVSGKFVASNIWHMNAKAAALDIGVMVNTHFFSFTGRRENGMNIGMSISNYGTKMRYEGMDLLSPIDILPNEHGNYKDVEGQYKLQGWELPLIFRVGVSISPIVRESQRLTLAVDALHPNNNSESLNMGAQYEFKLLGIGRFYLRGGFRGIYMDETEYGVTFGGGFHLTLMHNKVIKIDYAYKDVGILGNTASYTIGFNF